MHVIPAYDQLQQDFKVIANKTTLPAVCRVAAHAAFLMTRKYYGHLVMCPDRKLQWFADNDWPLQDIIQIRDIVIKKFYKKFKPSPAAQPVPPVHAMGGAVTEAPPTSSNSAAPIGVDCWQTQSAVHANPTQTTAFDNIIAYDTVLPQSLLPNTTVLQYWDHKLTTTPHLTAMGLAYVSAPGMSSKFSFGLGADGSNPRSVKHYRKW
ncbi:hypothetical protein EVJ58_g4907 [Rhodofomes roseus]|uniref:Uncharacterized protein n=1 Tax=Rhodofomes roseus TaxID=34475 RepID=A0A4Y9YFP9_9APHY|nr:hypothetical protein EVJ58_g4907 [Rhodofomes roseus]